MECAPPPRRGRRARAGGRLRRRRGGASGGRRCADCPSAGPRRRPAPGGPLGAVGRHPMGAPATHPSRRQLRAPPCTPAGAPAAPAAPGADRCRLRAPRRAWRRAGLGEHGRRAGRLRRRTATTLPPRRGGASRLRALPQAHFTSGSRSMDGVDAAASLAPPLAAAAGALALLVAALRKPARGRVSACGGSGGRRVHAQAAAARRGGLARLSNPFHPSPPSPASAAAAPACSSAPCATARGRRRSPDT